MSRGTWSTRAGQLEQPLFHFSIYHIPTAAFVLTATLHLPTTLRLPVSCCCLLMMRCGLDRDIECVVSAQTYSKSMSLSVCVELCRL